MTAAAAKDKPVRQIPRDKDGRLIYRPDGEMLRRFVADESPVAIIRGPVGSGKSVAWCMRVWRHCATQRPSPVDGVRRSRWAVIRNTYPELKTTTIKTWLDLFPEELYGKFYWGMPLTHKIKVYDIEIEVIFLALDKPEDISKLRSLELTGVCFNELQYIPKELFDEAQSRTKRFPAVKDGGSAWFGVIADMNAPDEDHWLPLMLGEVEPPQGMSSTEREMMRWPSNWAYFLQPAGLIEITTSGGLVTGYEDNPAAENRNWLDPGYYRDMVVGKSKAFIDQRIMNRITLYADGDPVHTAFRVETHVAKTILRPVPGYPIRVGLDFGRSPAALFAQQIDQCWYVLDELIGFNEGATMFAPKVKRFLEEKYAGYQYTMHGDPKGQDKGQADERTAYDIFRANGIPVTPAPVKQNNIKTRLDAVDHVLTGMWNGKPRFLVSPACRTYKAAMAGKYCWKKGDEGRAEPEKNRYSHVADAGQYLILGGGEGREMIGLTRQGAGQVQARVVSARRGARRRVG
jgi:hypothetical protein